MSGKMARSWDQTSFGTAGTPEALRSPPTGFRGTLPSAIVYAVPEFIWGIPVQSDRSLSASRMGVGVGLRTVPYNEEQSSI
jgi:hypothetical protein